MEEAGHPLLLTDDVEVEEPGPGEVRVRVTHCGICRSDLHLLEGRQRLRVSAILGHEASGVVAAVGPGTTVRPGTQVVLTLNASCGGCFFCARGQAHLCTWHRAIPAGTLPDGTTRLSRRGETVYRGLGVGALAECVVLPEPAVVPLQEGVPLELACLLGCAVLTVGATAVCERPEDAPEWARSHTRHGVDFAFDAVGSPDIVETALDAVRRGGTVVWEVQVAFEELRTGTGVRTLIEVQP